jgi:hypothetical protein
MLFGFFWSMVVGTDSMAFFRELHTKRTGKPAHVGRVVRNFESTKLVLMQCVYLGFW